jgi:hypothetical protein
MGLFDSAKKNLSIFSSMVKPNTIEELDSIKQDVAYLLLLILVLVLVLRQSL